jgi:hypothetical protein
MTDSRNDIGTPWPARRTIEPAHRNEVIHTNQDDGLWLVCYAHGRRHWEIGLGFHPSVEDITIMWVKHLTEEGEP